MMIVSAKVSKRKLFTGLLITAAIVALLITLCGKWLDAHFERTQNPKLAKYLAV